MNKESKSRRNNITDIIKKRVQAINEITAYFFSPALYLFSAKLVLEITIPIIENQNVIIRIIAMQRSI